jgi:hypothetical protein
MTRAFVLISVMAAAVSGCSSDEAPAPVDQTNNGGGSGGGDSDGSPAGSDSGSASDVPVTSCTDGVKNGDESDVDCGGDCSPCQLGKDCRAHSDCASVHCINAKCQECAPGTSQCSTATRPATCVNGMWVVANNDCPTMCDLNTGMCVGGSE